MRLPRTTGAVSGLLLVVLGIWGGIIPFVGPYFGYGFGGHATWHFTTDRLWLNILPAVATIIGGSILLGASHRVNGWVGGWLALAGGVWFLLGPSVSLFWEHPGGPIGSPLGGADRQAIEMIGFFYGLGALITALAAFATGRFVSRPQLVEEPAPAVATGAAARPPRTRRFRRGPARGRAVPPAPPARRG